jgi:hypothetical protein
MATSAYNFLRTLLKEAYKTSTTACNQNPKAKLLKQTTQPPNSRFIYI